MVEVAIGPDDRSVSATILHAVKSIPSVKEDAEPDHVFVTLEDGSVAVDQTAGLSPST